jgi:hypothetical protein
MVGIVKILMLIFSSISAHKVCDLNLLVDSGMSTLRREASGHNITLQIINNIDEDCIVKKLCEEGVKNSDYEGVDLNISTQLSVKIGTLMNSCAKDYRKSQIFYFESMVEMSITYNHNYDNQLSYCYKQQLSRDKEKSLLLENFDDTKNYDCSEVIRAYEKSITASYKFAKNECIVSYPKRLASEIKILLNVNISSDAIIQLRRDYYDFIEEADAICSAKTSVNSPPNLVLIFALISIAAVTLCVASYFCIQICRLKNGKKIHFKSTKCKKQMELQIKAECHEKMLI